MWILTNVICDYYAAHLGHTYGNFKIKFDACNNPYVSLYLSKYALSQSNVDLIVGFKYQPVILLLSKINSNACVKGHLEHRTESWVSDPGDWVPKLMTRAHY